jgi:hypothetical protein
MSGLGHLKPPWDAERAIAPVVLPALPGGRDVPLRALGLLFGSLNGCFHPPLRLRRLRFVSREDCA